jgi:hypothetical protein
VALSLRNTSALSVVVLAACNALTGADALSSANADSDVISEGGRPTPSSDAGGGSLDPPPGGSRGTDGAVGGTTDGGFEASAQVPDFADSFDRADGTTIGNGWIEKSDSFSLVGGAVVQGAVGDFTNFLLWRPISEPATNVEISVDVTYGDTAEPDPSLFARIQPSSEAENEIDAYTFYTWENRTAVIDRLDPNTGFATLASGDLSPQPAKGQTFRLFFRVTGDNPVRLEGSVLKPDGTVVASLSAADGTSMRITAPGRIGFGSGRAQGTRWDNFTRIDLK